MARVSGGVLGSGPGGDDQAVEMVTLRVATRVSSWSVSTRGAVLVSCGSLFLFGLGLFGSLWAFLFCLMGSAFSGFVVIYAHLVFWVLLI